MPQGWRSCAILSGAVLVLLGDAAGAVAATCQPSSEYTVIASRVAVAGLSSVEVSAQVTPNAEVVVIATPSAVDVQLQGSADADVAVAAADNPVRRLGSRRLILTAGPRGDLSLHVFGKERQGHGSVKVLIVPLAAWRNVPGCREALRRVAAGDAHYARAEGQPGGAGPARGINAAAEYQAAAAAYEAAAEALENQGETPLLAEALLAAGAARYQDTSQWREAHDDAAHASEAFRRLGDSYAATRATAVLAGADLELALTDRGSGRGSPEAVARRLASVRQQFMDLAQFYGGRGELFDQALALNNAGLSDYYAGKFGRGLRSYREALSIYLGLRESRREAQVLQNIAVMEYELGRFTEAKRDYARALEVLGPLPSDELSGDILNNQALVEYASGDLDAALLHYAQALSEFERLQVPLQAARSLHGLGIVYYAAGDRLRALDYFGRALEMRSQAQDARGRAATLRAMASVLSDLGRAPEAIGLRQEALALAVAPTVRVRIEAQLALDLEKSGEQAQAMTVAAQALKDAAGTPRSYQALVFATRAQLEYDEQLIDPAQRDIDRALNLLEGAEAVADQYGALVLAARIARAHRDNKAAESLVDRALRLAEQMRLESSNPEMRAGIWQGLKPAFDLKIDLLASPAAQVAHSQAVDRSEIAAEMLSVAEAYRARSLADYWRARGSGGADNDTPRERLRMLYREIADRRTQLETRVERSGEDDPRSRALRADIASLRREADSLHRATSGGEAPENTSPAGNPAAIKKIAEMIPGDSAVIEYWLGAERARAWVITRQGVVMVSLGDTDSAERNARALHAALSHFSASSEDRTRMIADLSRQVIGLLPSEVLQHRSLIIIPDGALHYVPFAVLQERTAAGDAPLVGDHVIVTAPSLAAARWHRAEQPGLQRVLIVSDPVYSAADPRVPRQSAAGGTSVALTLSRSPQSFERLPATAVEAAKVAGMFQSGEVDGLSGLAASRTAFLERDLARYRIIHVAAHAVTDTEAPLLSALILSTRDSRGATVPGQVFAGELAIRRLNAEVFVLSACDTGLGRELKGEGLLGLRYAAHAAGAESVLASLWPATERATSDLMTAFYVHYIRDQNAPALALARAMREVRTQLPDPALWGAFEISAAGAPAMFTTDRN